MARVAGRSGWTIIATLVGVVVVTSLWPSLSSANAAAFDDVAPRAAAAPLDAEANRPHAGTIARVDHGYHRLAKGPMPAQASKWGRSGRLARWGLAAALVALTASLHRLDRRRRRPTIPARAPRSRRSIPDGSRGPPTLLSTSALRRPAQRDVAVLRDHCSEVFHHARPHLGAGRSRPERAPLGPHPRDLGSALA